MRLHDRDWAYLPTTDVAGDAFPRLAEVEGAAGDANFAASETRSAAGDALASWGEGQGGQSEAA